MGSDLYSGGGLLNTSLVFSALSTSKSTSLVLEGLFEALEEERK